MASFVIDASATLPWCFEDEATAYTEGLLNRCAAGEEVMVASVWPLEITTTPWAPAVAQSATTSSTAAAGTAMSARSTGAPTALTRGKAGRPLISVACG